MTSQQPRLVKAGSAPAVAPNAPVKRFTADAFRREVTSFKAAKLARNPRQEFAKLFKPEVQ